jgi:hypothetical protein
MSYCNIFAVRNPHQEQSPFSLIAGNINFLDIIKGFRLYGERSNI